MAKNCDQRLSSQDRDFEFKGHFSREQAQCLAQLEDLPNAS
jgi:hypothetical protein